MKMEGEGAEADRVSMVEARVHTIGRRPYKEEDLIST